MYVRPAFLFINFYQLLFVIDPLSSPNEAVPSHVSSFTYSVPSQSLDKSETRKPMEVFWHSMDTIE